MGEGGCKCWPGQQLCGAAQPMEGTSSSFSGDREPLLPATVGVVLGKAFQGHRGLGVNRETNSRLYGKETQFCHTCLLHQEKQISTLAKVNVLEASKRW